MKKFTAILIIPAALLASCTPKEYKLTGTVEGGLYGEKIFLMEQGPEGFVKMDSTTLDANGTFLFTGAQSQAVYRYLTYTDGISDPVFIDFFLENGKIEVKLMDEPGKSKVSGTRVNNEYRKFNDKINELRNRVGEIIGSTEGADRQQIMLAMEAIDREMAEMVKQEIKANSGNPLGIHLLTQYYYFLDNKEMEELLAGIPESLHNEAANEMKEYMKRAALTEVGKKFTDFEMANPDGEPVTLSDYVGKGQVVLVDFWAAWCAPCREEMPQLAGIYEKYKDKGFEIVGVSLDMDEDLWKKGIEQLKMTWPQMSDLNYFKSEGAWLYTVTAIPYTVLMNRDGTIAARGMRGEELERKLAELLDGV